jgi:hypothetical protein
MKTTAQPCTQHSEIEAVVQNTLAHSHTMQKHQEYELQMIQASPNPFPWFSIDRPDYSLMRCTLPVHLVSRVVYNDV